MPPAISTIGESKASRAAIAACGIVACESLIQRTPFRSATVSSRCGTPANVRATVAIALASTPIRRAASAAPSTSASMWRPGRRTSSAETTRSPPTISQPSSSHASSSPRPGRSMPYHASAADGSRSPSSREPASSWFRTTRPSGTVSSARSALTARYASTVPWRSRWSSAMFVYRATSTPRLIVGSCSSESSSTTQSSGPSSSDRSTSGVPMFPPRTVGRPPSASIAARSDAVVVLPFVPVTPASRAPVRRMKRSTSLRTWAPRRLGCAERLAKPRIGRGKPG